MNLRLIFCLTGVVFPLTESLCAGILGQVLASSLTGEPVVFANVSLLSAEDSSLIGLVYTAEDGHFLYESDELVGSSYLLSVSAIGYKTYSAIIDLSTSETVDVGVLILEREEYQIKEVVVQSKRPFVEQQGNMLIANVSNSLVPITGDFTDLLSKIPGVNVMRDRVSINGVNGVAIYINGKLTRHTSLTELYALINVDQIEKIEISSVPGAAYDAEGLGGIVNIVLKKGQLYGLTGSASMGMETFDQQLSSALGLSLSNFAQLIRWNASVRIYDKKQYSGLRLDRRLDDGSRYRQSTIDIAAPRGLSSHVSLDFFSSKKETISASLGYSIGDNNRVAKSRTIISSATEQAAALYDLLSPNDMSSSSSRFWTGLDYQYVAKNSGGFDASLEYIVKKESPQSLIENNFIVGKNDLGVFESLENNQEIDLYLYTTKVDYYKYVGNGYKLSLGGKANRVSIRNGLQLSSRSEVDSPVSTQSSFDYDEDIAALYAELSKRSAKLDFNVGLRYEYSFSTGVTGEEDQLKQRINQLFPSGFVTYHLDHQLDVSFSFGRRIRRPSYRALNPFFYSYDAFTTKSGNPTIRPELTLKYELSLTFRKQPLFGITYLSSSDNISSVYLQDDSNGEAIRTIQNLSSYEHWSFRAFYPTRFHKNMSGYIGAMINYDKKEGVIGGVDFEADVWGIIPVIHLEYRVRPFLRVEFDYIHVSGGIDGMTVYNSLNSQSGVHLGFQLLDNKLNVKVGAENLFVDFYDAEVDFSNLNYQIDYEWNSTTYSLGASYKLGMLKKKKPKPRTPKDERLEKGESSFKSF